MEDQREGKMTESRDSRQGWAIGPLRFDVINSATIVLWTEGYTGCAQ
jgi:hypothetical protein